MHRRPPVVHQHPSRVIERSLMLPLMLEVRALVNADVINRRDMLRFFTTFSASHALIYALLLERDPNCFFDLMTINQLDDIELLTLLTSIEATLNHFTSMSRPSIALAFRGSLNFLDINTFFLDSWNGLPPQLFRNRAPVITRDPMIVVNSSQLVGHPRVHFHRQQPPQIDPRDHVHGSQFPSAHVHGPQSAQSHRHQFFSPGSNADVSRSRREGMSHSLGHGEARGSRSYGHR